jgi:hypothetical protein
LIVLAAYFLANNAYAGFYTTCEWDPGGTVSTPTGTSTTQGSWYCTVENDGSISPDAPDDSFSGGGGGGITGVWVRVDGPDYQAEVNVVQNQVRTNSFGCEALTLSRQVVAGQILVKNPNLNASTVVTVLFSDGKQTFQRLEPFSTFQMIPTSNCGP